MACEIRHALLRLRPDAIDAGTFLGVQDAGPGEPPLLMVNCRACRSTLAVEAPLSEIADLFVRARCRPGYVIQDDDAEARLIHHWIPGAMARHGMHMERVPGGWRCCSTGRPRPTPTAPRCLKCGGDARECDCAALALIRPL